MNLSKLKAAFFGFVSVPSALLLGVALLAANFPILTIAGTAVYIAWPFLREYLPAFKGKSE